MRLNRFLASAGLGSRRSCENLILEGWVTFNGKSCTQLATEVGPEDEVRVHGRVVHSNPLTYLILFKPTGFVCTRSDPHADRTVYDLLPPHMHDLAHVGRLDKDSAGLLLLTNDGALTQSMTHPSHQMDKEYEVQLDKALDKELVPKLVRGFQIEGGWGKMESVFFLAPTKLKVVLRQGINRQIRKMFYRLGYEVKKLVRTRIGTLKEPTMKAGEWRLLKKEEIASLRETQRVRKEIKRSPRESSRGPRPDRKPPKSGGQSRANPRPRRAPRGES